MKYPCVLPLVTLVMLAATASAEELPALAFLQKPTPSAAPTFSWPEASAFERAWSSKPRLVRIAEVDLTGTGEGSRAERVLVSIWPLAGERFELRVEGVRERFEDAANVMRRRTWQIADGALAAGKLRLVDRSAKDPVTIELTVRRISPIVPITSAARIDFAYVATLLTRDGPAYEPHPPDLWRHQTTSPRLEAAWAEVEKLYAGGERSKVAPKLEALLESDTPRVSEHWSAAAEWAHENAPDLALRIYRHWIVVGECSRDTRPQSVARKYAELCFERGRLGCFLDLQVQIMGNQFSRVAWSSYAERAHQTESARLVSAGIDVERLFRGLVLRYAIDGDAGRELWPWRIGKAAAEANDPNLQRAFERLVEDESLDEYNRFRAATALASLFAAQNPAAPYDEALTRVAKLRVAPAVERYIALRAADQADKTASP